MTNYNTTRNLSYGGFMVATAIAVLALVLNRDLASAGVLTYGFLGLTGFHAVRKGFGNEDKEGKNDL